MMPKTHPFIILVQLDGIVGTQNRQIFKLQFI